MPILLAAHVIGCGGAKHPEEPAYAQPPPQLQGYPQPFQHAPPGATPRAGGGASPEAGAPPPPAPAPDPFRVGTTERNLTTLQGALNAFGEDEIRLSGMLDDESIQLSQSAVCDRVCDALASMRRSADAICELAGSDDERCGRAREKLKSNTTRISAAGCRCE